ncbi:hypothetical protein PHLGIDRAFT_128318 [Phlebiopsis gigantea 11061_1 CR5-6]|uniref:C3H1-type domain-containing protein n=1 Tax=Phlebiopsis gigantea (strain 11061_1 CR5-6) TaxID=745531 RepID=A0A0C3S6Q6_PHLG1|nr:hypothetical protein PHLGIDRAFT_128318 [Phlebiopsis gigantea 11061_1 CR5-6]
MPDAENGRKEDSPQDPPRDLEREKEKDKSSKSKGSAKTKDLSHVPCKFFKVGSCTAGSSCPFSHTILEPGQAKEICAWFIKGNCKFGHKCALAHVLPGQSMSMDRKNKKAAQAAASAANSGRDGHRSGRSQKSSGQGSQNGASSSRNPLLSGSTAPTRSLSSSRNGIPMPLKATLSPSAPAPPVQNTEFASFGLPDESNKLPSAPAQSKPAIGSGPSPPDVPVDDSHITVISDGPTPQSPLGSPVSPHHSGNIPTDAALPLRAPDASVISSRNGFSPGTSPTAAALSTSPFSAPGTQSVFMTHSQQRSTDFKTRSGLSASLGAMNWATGDSQGMTSGRARYGGVYSLQDEVVVEDGELEEFIPGSLTDLLTPEERSRRFSRTNPIHPAMPPSEDNGLGSRDMLSDAPHHRHSRSVPAPSLLQDIRSIWTDNGETSAGHDSNLNGMAGGGLGNGTPSSFQSNPGFGGRGEDALSPSNASAAFLPGLHHYMNTKATQRPPLAPGMSSMHGPPSALSSSRHVQGFTNLDNLAMSPPRMNAFAAGTTFDGRTSDLYLAQAQRQAAGRPIPNTQDGFNGDIDRTALSPSTRALQAHAPGQSLPQGLAAGYSRIHALPPPPSVASPSSTLAFSPGRSAGMSPGAKATAPLSGMTVDWGSPSAAGEQSANASTGLESLFSRLSYSAAASRPSAPSGVTQRIVSGRGWQNTQGTLSSPLSGPVLTGDDDDLFSFDG